MEQKNQILTRRIRKGWSLDLSASRLSDVSSLQAAQIQRYRLDTSTIEASNHRGPNAIREHDPPTLLEPGTRIWSVHLC